MLDIKQNRLNYGKLLAPPDGFTLVRAVGTTYSLDLYALLSIPVAMFFAKDLDGYFTQNRYDILEAIRKSKERITIFCQQGKIKVPSKYNSLLAFLENCIVEVKPPTAFASFHPKIWVLRYEKKKEIKYRLIVLSRNLTFDRSWDLAYCADGELQKTENKQSKKIAEYLQYFHDEGKIIIEENFLKDLAHIKFDLPEQFLNFEFHPILNFTDNLKNRFPNPLLTSYFKKLLIISPFVDEKTLEMLIKNNKELLLFSREEELDKISPELLKKISEIYCLNSSIIEYDIIIDTEPVENLNQNLHAKFYIGETGRQRNWYIGSANCTSPALYRNTEFLVQLNSENQRTGIKEIKEKLCKEKQALFIPYFIKTVAFKDDIYQDIEHLLRQLIFNLCNIVFESKIIKRENQTTYNFFIETDLSNISFTQGFTVSINLIGVH